MSKLDTTSIAEAEAREAARRSQRVIDLDAEEIDLSPGAINTPVKPPDPPSPRWVWDASRARILMQSIGQYAELDWILEHGEEIGQWAIELVEILERIRGVEFDPDKQQEEE